MSIGLGAIGMLALAAWAQTTAPSAGGGAAGDGIDLSSPRATLITLYTAMRNGDAATARACMHFADPKQAELFDLNFTQMYGPMRLLRAMEAQFGEAGKKPFANAALERPVDRTLERLKTAEFDIQGDKAKASEKKSAVNPSAENELTGVQLLKENDGWKVVAGTLSDLASDLPDNQQRLMRVLKAAVDTACGETIARMHRGELATPAAAYADYQARIQSATQAAARGN
jgi:hypothetical protein